jgi:integrase
VVLKAERGKHPAFCFTFRGAPIAREMTNSAWHTAIQKGGITDFRFHHLRHTSASWHRQAGTSCDELKDLGGWKLGPSTLRLPRLVSSADVPRT